MCVVCVYMCCVCVCASLCTQLYRLCVYTYVYICECVYRENGFYLFLLPPNQNIRFCIFRQEGDRRGYVVTYNLSIVWTGPKTRRCFINVCPCTTYLCMCYRKDGQLLREHHQNVWYTYLWAFFFFPVG